MKLSHIRLFEEYVKSLFPVREFDEPTAPAKPYRRKLSDDERRFLWRFFANFSWSDVDAEGRILLGNGMEEIAKYYITEDDLRKYMESMEKNDEFREYLNK